ncbi:GntP family permease [Microbacterium gorillae]|uniref:GntP family permease n=1 Tax=Microbacterium gorillae TaxID=1231063 RepID=UPI00058E6FE1|nr:gluconate:H+ symporter [Microbacterium gorillae]
MIAQTLIVRAADIAHPDVPGWRLVIAALIGFAIIIALITWLKLHPFLALTIGAISVGLMAGLNPADTVTSFSNGFGATMGSVGVLVALGAMFGKILADSGGADRIVDTLVSRASPRALPWVMALVGSIIGLPMFFEIGLVLLMPVIILVARRSGQPLMKIAMPAIAGLSTMHALVPPHPGPLTAIGQLNANLGLTLLFGVIVAIPTVIIAGPLFAGLAAKWAPVPVPDLFATGDPEQQKGRTRPSFGATMTCVLLPVVLMMAKAIADIFEPKSMSAWKLVLDFLGTPMIALLLTVIIGMVVLGRGGRMGRDGIMGSVESGLPPIAGIILIVGAGGGFKQVLIDTGIGDVITGLVAQSGVSVLLIGWFVAALVRVATGSATVAIVTASGIMAQSAAGLSPTHTALLVLAVGSGSVFLSHVNDAGFWLVKQYLGTTIGQTFKTWTVVECLISVVGLAGVMALSLVV